MKTVETHTRWCLIAGIAAWASMFVLPFAIWSKATSLILRVAFFLPIITGITAVVLGHIAGRRAAREGKTQSAAAAVGLTLGYLAIAYLIMKPCVIWVMNVFED
jgi:hypothetical protein